ncbi:MAG: Hpt domain-containing protein [Nitrosopumilus sp.]
MSDEFISLATKEINEEISGIEIILNSCKNNDDVNKNSAQIQRHTHKIKGLAPMMGKEELGELSSHLDTMLKKIIGGNQIQEIFEILTESINQMKNSMNEPNSDLNPITNKIKQYLSNL